MKIIIDENQYENLVNEISINAKKRNEKNIENALMKGKSGINGIRTIAVFTAENPDTTNVGKDYNHKANHSLSKNLKNAGYIVIPAKGKFGGFSENSFAVINISIEAVMNYCAKYQQTSFIYSTIEEGDNAHSSYYEKSDVTKPISKTNPYVEKDSSDDIIDMSNADDMFTIIGKNFKYQIPFPYLMEISNTINKNFLNEENKKWMLNTLEETIDYSMNKKGIDSAFRRKVLYKN